MPRSDIKLVFSYRHEDTKGAVGRIYDQLIPHYGDKNIFIDFDSIPGGADFHEHIQTTLDGCDVLIAVIGPNWIGSRKGKPPRIKDDNDWVRLEVETALQRKIPVIPVLVDDAIIPREEQLPEKLHPLLRRLAVRVTMAVIFAFI